MHPKRPSHSDRGINSERQSQWNGGIRSVPNTIPDIRMEKVRRIREAIARDAYDSDEFIDRLLQRLGDDIEILSRKE